MVGIEIHAQNVNGGGHVEAARIKRKCLIWRAWRDSNPRPLPSEGSTLSS